jgi:hypothetical protein
MNATVDVDLARNRKVVAAEPVNVSVGALCRDRNLLETSSYSMDRRDADRQDASVQVQGGVHVQVHVEVNVNVFLPERHWM